MAQKNQVSIESPIMELLTDLILEIFSRLSCEDVSRSQCVCRKWYKFLSDPNFTSNYRRKFPFTTMFFSQNFYHRDYVFLLQFTDKGEFVWRLIITDIPDAVDNHAFLLVIGSCSGLLFLIMYKYGNPSRNTIEEDYIEQVYFCNPLLGGCVALRDSKVRHRPAGVVEYKLGLVPSTAKIKLLRIVFNGGRRVYEANIFTFGVDDKWRRLEDPLILLYERTRGTSFNGAYHWVAEDENVDWICTFDFGEEKCGRLSKPCGLSRIPWKARLSVLNDHLSLIKLSPTCDEMTVWAMNEYAVAGSWSKIILLASWFPYKKSLVDLIPITVLPNGDILLLAAMSGLISFSPETKQCTRIAVSHPYPYIVTSSLTTYAPRFY